MVEMARLIKSRLFEFSNVKVCPLSFGRVWDDERSDAGP